MISKESPEYYMKFFTECNAVVIYSGSIDGQAFELLINENDNKFRITNNIEGEEKVDSLGVIINKKDDPREYICQFLWGIDPGCDDGYEYDGDSNQTISLIFKGDSIEFDLTGTLLTFTKL